MQKKTNFRIIKQSSIEVPCYFYGYFKSPGLESYPNFNWVNDDYQLIKSKDLDDENCFKIAKNFFVLGKEFGLFQNIDYFVVMPLKSNSVSSLEKIVLKLISLIETNLAIKVKLVSDLFQVQDYPKFWENRLKVSERKKEIKEKISLKKYYYHLFDNKSIIIIDDVVSTGISISEIALLLTKNNNDIISLSSMTYGSVYQWQKIYS